MALFISGLFGSLIFLGVCRLFCCCVLLRFLENFFKIENNFYFFLRSFLEVFFLFFFFFFLFFFFFFLFFFSFLSSSSSSSFPLPLPSPVTSALPPQQQWSPFFVLSFSFSLSFSFFLFSFPSSLPLPPQKLLCPQLLRPALMHPRFLLHFQRFLQQYLRLLPGECSGSVTASPIESSTSSPVPATAEVPSAGASVPSTSVTPAKSPAMFPSSRNLPSCSPAGTSLASETSQGPVADESVLPPFMGGLIVLAGHWKR